MFAMLEKLKDGVLDILLPKFCVGCGREGLYICKDCEVFLSEVENTVPGLTSVWEYEGLMEKLIYKIKFDGCYHIIDELVEKALKVISNFQLSIFNLPPDTVITYVPMWPKKERRRGFNQSEVIAKKLGDVYHLVVRKILEKARDNRSQVGLGPRERFENVRNVFKMNFQFPISNFQNVLLVDDVYTTGATMRECAKVLKKAGVKNIWGFTLSRKMNIQNC